MRLRIGIRGAVLLSLALIATAGFVASQRRPSPASLVRDVARAIGSDLPFHARLSGGFAPGTEVTVRGAEPPDAVALSPDARIAIAQLEKRLALDASPDARAAVGVAFLIQGDADRAISLLAHAAGEGKSAARWSDLSAAYLAKAASVPGRRIELLGRALEAAHTSLTLAPSPEARFNKALAAQGLAPLVGEGARWDDYLRLEPDESWRRRAREIAQRSLPVNDARARWDEQQRALRLRLGAGDRAFAVDTATAFPEAANEFFRGLLTEWSRAHGGDMAGRRLLEQHAQLLGEAIHAATADPLPRDEAAALLRGDVILARGYRSYANGLSAYNGGDYGTARTAFESARVDFAAAGSAVVLWADAQLATLEFQQRDLAGADQRLAGVERAARTDGYGSLLGRALWLRGLVHAKAWRLTEAIAALRESAAVFDRMGQQESAVSVYNVLADTLRMLGERHDSWENIAKTLEGLGRVRSPVRRYLALYNASLFARSERLLEAALLFQNAAVREADAAGPSPIVESRVARAVILFDRGDQAAARADLDAAAARLSNLPAGPQRAYVTAEIDALEAQHLSSDPAQRAQRLQESIVFFTASEPARLPGLYLALARFHLAQGAAAAAETALAQGIDRLEQQQIRLNEEALKISYLDEGWDLFGEMIRLQLVANRNVARSFEYAERSRARALLGTSERRPRVVQSLAEIQRRLPDSGVLVYYATLPDRLLIWSVTRQHAAFRETPLRTRELDTLVERHNAALVEGRRHSTEAARLYDLLIAPIVETWPAQASLVFAADGPLQQLPFATLRAAPTGRFLIEDHAILMTPSASFFAAGLDRPADTAPLTSALLVGNPASAGPALPGAESEVTEVAALYPRREVLTGRAASKARFLTDAPKFDVVHFGGHGYVNREYPLLSRLVFASEDGERESSLFAYEISRLPFAHTRVVVLAACSTATGPVSRGEGVVSMARPFLSAGVPLVIGSQWDVDDRVTRELFRAFHRALAVSNDPVQALRTAQLAFIASPEPALAAPAAWGGFVALGIAAR